MPNYRTHDLYQACYLEASGNKLLRLEDDETDQRRIIFVFDSVPEQFIKGWQVGSALVNAVAYASSIRKLKRKLHEFQEAQHG